MVRCHVAASPFALLLLLPLTTATQQALATTSDFVVRPGETKIWKSASGNYHNTWFEGPPDLAVKAVSSQGNEAFVQLIAMWGQSAKGKAVAGVQFTWSMHPYTRQKMKDRRVRVRIHVWGVLDPWADPGGASAVARVNVPGFTDPVYSPTLSSGGTFVQWLTFYPTIEELERMGRMITVEAYAEAHSVFVPHSPTGASAVAVIDMDVFMDWVDSPSVKITKARMVSKDELGVDLEIKPPKSDPRQGPWSVAFNAVINGRTVSTRQYDVSKLLFPGVKKPIRFDVGTDPRKINLADYGVPRFTKNQKFLIEVIFSGPSWSERSQMEATVLLPVILIHGVTSNLLEEALAALPFMGLKGFLVRKGYDANPKALYKTLWGPMPYSSQQDTDAEIAARVFSWVVETQKATYADKVNLVGHSLGGLIGRYYVTQGGGASDVHKLITVGTALRGSTEFYVRAFALSPQQVDKKLHTSDGPDTHNLRVWLSPTYECLFVNDHGKRGQSVDLLYPNLFSPVPSPSDVGVGYYCIYGRQPVNRTASELLLTPVKVGPIPWYRCAKTFYDEGDGIVPCQSAAPDSPATTREILTPTGHAFLPSDAAVMPKILWALEDGDYGE